jgi:hypothetical protein
VLVQEQLLLAPWPDALLALPAFAAVRDGLGRLLFRGPRLRMGACEGRPRSITPDHAGRADYAGHAVNMAARYTEAAHGGQVVFDVTLAEKALAAWNAASAQQHQAAAAAAPSTIAEERSAGGGGSPGSGAAHATMPEAKADHDLLETVATEPPTAAVAAAAGDPRIALAPHEVRALGADIIAGAAAAAGCGGPSTTAELAATLRSRSGVSATRLDEIRALSGLSVRRLPPPLPPPLRRLAAAA